MLGSFLFALSSHNLGDLRLIDLPIWYYFPIYTCGFDVPFELHTHICNCQQYNFSFRNLNSEFLSKNCFFTSVNYYSPSCSEQMSVILDYSPHNYPIQCISKSHWLYPQNVTQIILLPKIINYIHHILLLYHFYK